MRSLKSRRRAWPLGLIVVGIIYATASQATAQQVPPTLSDYDVLHAGLIITDDLTNAPTRRLAIGGISGDQAVVVAKQVVEIESPVRVLGGFASQFSGGESRSVFVVVVGGGTFPFSGPAEDAVDRVGRTGRVTGIIVDAVTGEFLRGFIHAG